MQWVSTYKEKIYCRVICNASPRVRPTGITEIEEKTFSWREKKYQLQTTLRWWWCVQWTTIYILIWKQSAEWIDHEIAFGANLTSIGVIFLNCTKHPPIVWKLHLKMTKLRCHDYNGLRRARLVGLFNYIYVKNAHFEVK